MMLSKKITGIAIGLITATSICVAAAVGSNPFNNAFATTRGNGNLVCGDYETNLDWNISREEIFNLTSFEETYKTLDNNETDLISCSDIIHSITTTKGQYYRQESGKTVTNSLKFGTSSIGSISLVLTKQIDAIGFYACAYENDKDTGKSLVINENELEKTLPAFQTYEYIDTLRFFYDFSEPTNEITIAAKQASNNRFHIYSIGFYSKHNFPDATIPTKYTISFDANGGTGTMASVQVNKNSSYELPICTFTAPSGKDFDYWSVSGVKQTTSITVTSDITLVANWKDKASSGSQTTLLPDNSASAAADNVGFTQDGITVLISNGIINATQFRVYKNKTLTISSTTHTIKSIEFTCTASGTAQYGPGCFTTASGYTYSGTKGTWSGSASSIVFTAASNQVRITQIVVTYE